MKFLFADKKSAIDTCCDFSRKMPQFNDDNIDQIIRSNYVVEEFDEEKTKQLAQEICKTTNLNVVIRSKSFEGQTNQTDEWYGTKYSVEDFSEGLKERMTNPKTEIKSKSLDLPPKNSLVPTNFDILNLDSEKSEKPVLLK